MASPDGEPAAAEPSSTEHGRRPRPLVTVVLVAGVTLVLDQLTKWWALETLADGRTIDLIWTLRFNLTFNTGAAFSFGGGGGLGPVIALAALAVVGILLWTGRSMGSRLGSVSLGLIVGGAIGNLVDRAFREAPPGSEGILQGAVVDFIDVQWWPVFNVADMGVVVGGILLAWVGFHTEER